MADNLTQLSASVLFNAKGWIAVVTGGGTGLGLMAARALAANGAKVYITGRRTEPLQKAELQDSTSGGSIVAIQMDVTSQDSIKSVVQTLTEREGYVNVLVNNAGVSSLSYYDGGFETLTGTPAEISAAMLAYQKVEDWTRVYNVNVTSLYFASAAFLPLLCAARDSHGFPEAGNIINITSISGITKDTQGGHFAYNASKAAAISLTNMLAMEFKQPGLECRVNTIAPGFFPSEMVKSIERHKNEGKEFYRDLAGFGIPFGRPGNSEDYAKAVLGLALNQYCTGSTVVVDGGWLLAHS